VALAAREQPITWQELERAPRWSARLARLGVRAGDRVMVVGENCPRW
jgi:long-subunit acyl-CoA synthetase (AMP-forming)